MRKFCNSTSIWVRVAGLLFEYNIVHLHIIYQRSRSGIISAMRWTPAWQHLRQFAGTAAMEYTKIPVDMPTHLRYFIVRSQSSIQEYCHLIRQLAEEKQPNWYLVNLQLVERNWGVIRWRKRLFFNRNKIGDIYLYIYITYELCFSRSDWVMQILLLKLIHFFSIKSIQSSFDIIFVIHARLVVCIRRNTYYYGVKCMRSEFLI